MIVRDRAPGLGLLVNDRRYAGWTDDLNASISSDTYKDTGTVLSPEPDYGTSAGGASQTWLSPSDTYVPTSNVTGGSYSPASTESGGVGSTIASIFGTLFQVAGGVATQLLKPGMTGYVAPPPKTGMAAVPTWVWIAGGSVLVLGLTGAVAFSGKKSSMSGYHGRRIRRRR